MIELIINLKYLNYPFIVNNISSLLSQSSILFSRTLCAQKRENNMVADYRNTIN